jgi:hypothetical protein
MISTMTFDTKQVQAGLERLTGELATSLARSMAVAGGQVLRDEAKARAPVGTSEGGSITPGLLQSSIYLAYSDRSTDNRILYSISWNSRKAPHGHLLEFGHWMTHVSFKGPDGEWHSDPSKPLRNPRWIAARPFLRPANDAAGARAVNAMLERGRVRLPELLSGLPK